ncbi:MAG TPA: hypothetical protein VFS66_12150 [Acidimicrobiia bacterium]|nr:hypothetical protein [Acidimicrobiia bacterium]
MSLVLVDTTFLTDTERDSGDLDAALDDEDDVAVAAITVAELLVGAELASKLAVKTGDISSTTWSIHCL